MTQSNKSDPCLWSACFKTDYLLRASNTSLLSPQPGHKYESFVQHACFELPYLLFVSIKASAEIKLCKRSMGVASLSEWPVCTSCFVIAWNLRVETLQPILSDSATPGSVVLNGANSQTVFLCVNMQRVLERGNKSVPSADRGTALISLFKAQHKV